MNLFEVGGRWTKVVIIRAWAGVGPSLKTHKDWPRVEAALKSYKDSKFPKEVPNAMAALNKTGGKPVKFISLK